MNKSAPVPGDIEPAVPAAAGRNRTIDLLKLISIFAVLVLHADSFQRVDGYWELNFFLDNAARFAVPCFFMAAGYFLCLRYQRAGNLKETVLPYVRRLLFVFAAWSLVYFAAPSKFFYRLFTEPDSIPALIRSRMASRAEWIVEHPVRFLMTGTIEYLWFLPGLICGVLLLAAAVKLKKEKPFFVLAAALFIFGLLGKSYALSPAGIDLPDDFNTRNGPFFSSLFVFFGWFAAAGAFRLKTRHAALLAAAGLVMQLSEAWGIWKIFGGAYYYHDFVVGTVPYSLGLFLLAVGNPALVRSPRVTALASLVLGIYVFHPLVLFDLKKAAFLPPVLFEAVLPFLVFLVSAAVVAILKKIPLVSKTVS